MKDGKVFSGFHEAPIRFPPTFKYDVLRTLKRSKRSKVVNIQDHPGHLLEMDETEDEFEDVERASQASSHVSSTISQPTAEPWIEDDSYFYTTRPILDLNPTLETSTSASKSKVKWLSLLSPSFTTSIDKTHKVKSNSHKGLPPAPITAISSIPSSPLASDIPNAPDARKRRLLRPPPMILVNPTEHETKNLKDAEEEKGVYDSSSKKRVPSWYDLRIYFNLALSAHS